ncbi:MAG: long-chain fatty acid transporter [bacterium]|nr:long-chain fatty acid transporter [bacterium]
MTKKLSILVLLVFVVVGTGFATNGYLSHGYGAKSKGMAGAGTAIAFSTLDSVSNPAALVFLGKRIDLGVALFMPTREFDVSGNASMYPGTFPLTPGVVESGSKYFVIPHVGVNFMLNKNTNLGAAVYGNGGMNTDYDTAVFHGSSPTGVNLAQMFMDVTLSRKLAENHSIGLTAIIAYQMFRAKGLEAFSMFSGAPSNLTNNGSDSSLGLGIRVGYMGRLSKYLSVGASYQSRIKMQPFDNYAGLFAEEGDFDIPASFTVGIAVNPIKSLTLALDMQKIMYGKVNAIANPMDPMDFGSGILLGSENGAGFGWSDMTVFKIGLQYAVSDKLTLRAGFSTADQPIPSSEVMFNILAPGVIEQHLTFGSTLKLKNKKELTFYIMHGFSTDVEGPNPMEAPGYQTITLSMNQWEMGVGFSF